MSSRTAVLALFIATLVPACSFGAVETQCTPENEGSACGPGQECYRGFCVTSDSAGGRTGSSSDAGKSNGKGGSGGKSGEPTGTTMSPNMISPMNGGSDAKPSNGSGGKSGDSMTPPTQNQGDSGVPASADPCKAGETQTCSVAANGGGGMGCGSGKRTCQNGSFGPCVADNMPTVETCNGQDDDCDGTVDEESTVDCYPPSTPGCPAPGMGNCSGLCAFGQQRCVNGKLQDCGGAKTPAAESCDPVNGVAADENCDGVTDEQCMCTGSQAVACYNGPAGTAGKGICKNGMQTCTNGGFGACTGAVTPGVETCANEGADDDCNGVMDDIKDRNAVCMVPGGMGICAVGTLLCQSGSAALQCVAVPPLTESCNGLDDNCNGKIDDGFDLMTDANHCGSCTNACPAGNACCAGKCVNTQKDNANCGGCGTTHACAAGSSCTNGMCMSAMPTGGSGGRGGSGGDAGTMMPPACSNCATGEMCCNGVCTKVNTDANHCGACTTVCDGKAPACCSGRCEDLSSDNSCGQCDHKCGLLNGLACSCAMMSGSTAWQCAGLDVAGALQLCL